MIINNVFLYTLALTCLCSGLNFSLILYQGSVLAKRKNILLHEQNILCEPSPYINTYLSHTNTHAHMHVHAHTLTHTSPHTSKHTHTHTHKHTYKHTHTHIQTHTDMHAHTCTVKTAFYDLCGQRPPAFYDRLLFMTEIPCTDDSVQ